MKNWKLVAGFAVAGAALSLLLGAVAGNAFGVILLRLLLCALGAGALGWGMSFVAGRYLPGLGSSAGPEERAVGPGHVDIVLPAENPHETEAAELLAEGDTALEGAAEEVEDLGGAEVLEGELDGADEGSPGPMGPEIPTAAKAAVAEVLSEPEPVVDVMESADTAEPATLEPETSDASGAGTGKAAIPHRARGKAGLDSLGGDHDPETVARAVRTMLKRDKEG